MLKKCWGIVLWGIFFMALGLGIFNAEIYFKRMAHGRERSFSQDVPDYIVKLKQAHRTVTNTEVQAKLPLIEKELYSRLHDMEVALSKAIKFKNILSFSIIGGLCIFSGIGLIFRREIARRLVLSLSIVLTIWFFYLMSLVENITGAAVKLVFWNTAIDCFLENKIPINLCNDDLTFGKFTTDHILYLQLVICWALFSGTAIWYFSRKKIKEQFR